MTWHFLEVWGLLLGAFALGGLLGTLLYMGLAVSPLAHAQIAVADAIADRFAALRGIVERRRDAGLYRGQREAPAYVIPLPVPLAAPPPYDEAYPATAEEDIDARPWETPSDAQDPIAPTAEAYWEDDAWAPDEDDAHWPEDDYWSEVEEPETLAAGALALPDPEEEDDGAGDAVAEPYGEPYAEAFRGDPADPAGVFVHQSPGASADDESPDEERAGATVAGIGDQTEDQAEAGEAAGQDDPAGQESDEDAVDAVIAAEVPAGDGAPEAEPEPVVEAATDPEGEGSPDDAAAPASAGEAVSDTETEPMPPEAAEPADAPATAIAGEPADSQPGDTQAGDMETYGSPRPVPPGPPDPLSRADPATVVTLAIADGAIETGPDAAALAAASIVPLAPAPTEPAAPGAPARPPAARHGPAATLPPGTRPLALSGPRNGVPDNLQKIRGIGHKNEALLNSLGIFHFGQIAAWTPAEAQWVASQLAFPERLERDDWIGQAIVFATGGDTGYVKAGERGKGDDESPVAA